MAIIADSSSSVNGRKSDDSEGRSYLRYRHKSLRAPNPFISKWLEVGDRSRRNSQEIVSLLLKIGRKKHGIRLHRCGSYLLFREYVTEGTTKLISAEFCKLGKLCIFCAARRALKMTKKHIEKYELCLEESPNLKLYNLVLTSRDTDDLVKQFDMINSGFKLLWNRGKLSRHRAYRSTAFSSVMGCTRSIEIKRGRNSGLWHPHIHALLLVDGKLDQAQVVEEWAELVGQTVEETRGAQYLEPVDLRPRRGDDIQDASVIGAFMECFKYAMKFDEMTSEDLVSAFVALRGRRFLQSYGCVYGIPEIDYEDELLEDDSLLFIDLLFRHYSEGYRLEKQS